MIENLIEVLVGLTALVSFIYRISQLESKLYKSIDFVEDKLTERINKQENKFAVHLSNYFAKMEMHDYRIHSLDEKINHKFGRCWDEIKTKVKKED